MTLTRDQLHEALVDSQAISEEEFKKAELAVEASQIGIAGVLIGRGVLKDEQFGAVLAVWYNVPFVNLRRTHVPDETVVKLPEVFARTHSLLPIKEDETSFTIATDDPRDLLERSLLEKYLRKEVHYVFATNADLKAHMYLFAKDPKSAIATIVEHTIATQDGVDTTAIELIDAIINYAYQGGASDIHIEPEEEYTLIRYRQDGLLHDIAKVPVRLHNNLMTRLKVLSRLATDETRAAQDGKIRHKTQWGEEIEIRLSILPTTQAEKAVMRLLADKSQEFNLTNLGLSEADYGKVADVVQRPWGAILVTGPTGSGKTTTLYSILKVLNKREVNITTIEDPVEFDMEGVAQIQVNEKTDLTFAKGLRSIVRQDPDIIMVGEIRDSETAGIAVNAAMTGHLVLSTLHTNDASTTFPRLQDMGVEDFLIASTVNVVVAQRLVRKICANCIVSVQIDKVTEELLAQKVTVLTYLKEITGKKTLKGVTIYKGKGCHVCHETGYHGRMGVFEVLSVSEDIRQAIMAHKNADEIRAIALHEGMTTMVYDGVRKVTMGVTTLEEVLRVTSE
ncbi:MAG: GspE/PulE family protein [Patescibacteria group bacterium]